MDLFINEDNEKDYQSIIQHAPDTQVRQAITKEVRHVSIRCRNPDEPLDFSIVKSFDTTDCSVDFDQDGHVIGISLVFKNTSKENP